MAKKKKPLSKLSAKKSLSKAKPKSKPKPIKKLPPLKISESVPGSGLPKADGTKSKRILIVSDGTGETAAQMILAAMVQFVGNPISYTRFKDIRSESQIESICQDAAVQKNLIVYTLVSPQLRAYLLQKAWELSIPSVDLLGPLLVGLGNYFGYEPKMIAGLLRDVNDKYFSRIEAMEYTISHDDGKNLSKLEQADVIVLGISRTSKTPISMYLSHHGLKVANIPIITGFDIPEEVKRLDPRKVVCLTINPEELARIRRARLSRLGQDNGGEYADLDKVHQEVEYAGEIFERNRKWSVFDVTGKAIEETASEIIRLLSARRALPERMV